MSLEAAIQENTAAIKQLIAVMSGKPGVTPEVKASASKPAAASSVSSPAEKSAPASSAAIAYDDVKKITLALAKQNRDAAVAVLKEFGAENALKLKPEQYADFMKKAEAKLEELVKL